MLRQKKAPEKWWLEINTAIPKCTYYFGPFDNWLEAIRHRSGYVRDLLAEKAVGITTKAKKCQPKQITIFAEN